MIPEPPFSLDNGGGGPFIERRRWQRFRDASVQIVVWPASELCQRAEIVDESFGGIGLLLEGASPPVGSVLELLYNRAPMRSAVRHTTPSGGKHRVGCEWIAGVSERAAAVPRELGDRLKAGLYLIAALYDQADWSGLGRAVELLRQEAVAHGAISVAQGAERMLEDLDQPGLPQSYEGLLEQCIEAVSQAAWQ